MFLKYAIALRLIFFFENFIITRAFNITNKSASFNKFSKIDIKIRQIEVVKKILMDREKKKFFPSFLGKNIKAKRYIPLSRLES